MNTRIVLFHPAHLDVMCLRDNEATEKLKRDLLVYTVDARTVIHNGIPIFAFGIRVMSEGVGEFWFEPTIYVNKFPILTVKTMKEWVEIYRGKLNLHRIQATALKKNKKFIETCGLELESVLEKYCLKEDLYMYRRLF